MRNVETDAPGSQKDIQVVLAMSHVKGSQLVVTTPQKLFRGVHEL